MNVEIKDERLDLDWIELMREAKALGLTIEDIKLFLEKSREHSVFR